MDIEMISLKRAISMNYLLDHPVGFPVMGVTTGRRAVRIPAIA